MVVSNALATASVKLTNAGIAQPRREAASLLAFVLKKPNSFLIAHPEYELTDNETERFTDSVSRRAGREPFQYITGRQEFWGLDFVVTPDVLIPRPETEILVEAAIGILTGLEDPRFCEIGIGSGCISVSVLNAVASANAVGIDISEAALAVARSNAERHGVLQRIEFRSGDVFSGLDEQFDLIVSNPPYIPDEDFDALQAEVRDFEPHSALNGGLGGLEILELVVSGSPRYLKQQGELLLEIGIGQWDRVGAMFDPEIWHSVEHLPDLQGIPRIVRACLRS